jgi:hypothetical protein
MQVDLEARNEETSFLFAPFALSPICRAFKAGVKHQVKLS